MSQTRKDILIITLLVTLFFGAFLGSRPLTVPDEGRYAEIPREMIQDHDYLTPHINGIKYFEKPPLFYWLQAFNIKIFGENLWSVRFGTVMMGLLGCLMTYFAGKELYSRRAGLIACGILATSTLYYGLSRFITLDIMLSVWLTGCLFSFLLGHKKQNNYYFWAMYAFAALATLTKGFIGVIIPGAVIFLWLLFTNGWKNLLKYQIVTGAFIFLAIAAPWHILVQLKHPEFFKFYILDQQILRYFTQIADRDQAVWFLPAILFAGFFPWSIFLIGAIANHIKTLRNNFKQHSELLLLILWPIVVFAFFWPSQSQLSPYLLPMFPPMSLLLAVWFNNLVDIGCVLEGSKAQRNGMERAIPEIHTQYRTDRNRGSDCDENVVGINIYFLTTSLLTCLIAIAAWLKWPAPQPYLNLTTITLALSGLLSYLIYRYRGFYAGIISLMLLHGAFLITLNFSYPPTDERSIEPLAKVIQPLLSEDTVVASYQHHYHDLPFYIKRKVLLVEWYGELKHGMQHQDTTGLTIHEKDFWKHWQKPQRMFMILSLKDLRRLKKETNYTFHSLASTKRNVLVSNKVIK